MLYDSNKGDNAMSVITPDFIITAAVIYLAVISIVAAVITAADKALSKRERAGRIPEKTLFITAALGGAPAMLITMKSIRHKTRHKRFMIGLPLIIAVHITLAAVAFYRFFL